MLRFLVAALLYAALLPHLFAQAAAARATTIHVDALRTHARAFVPNQALGTSLDILRPADFDRVFSAPVIQESLSAGWGPITYRQNTELQIEAWHWNAQGAWSDAAHQSGYFTGSVQPSEFLRESYGYSLPHRGTTRNNGTERGYGRLTDGDPNTYWKSNPYLTSHFTGEDDLLHPQWVVIDLGGVQPINAMLILWADPYALSYRVQYWTGRDPMNLPVEGAWNLFPNGEIENGHGGEVRLKLAGAPISTRFLRIWMTKSSNTCDTHGSGDPRNCVGYAIREIYAGNIASNGSFVDLIKHVPDPGQTVTICSSNDPWHSASDENRAGGIQTGFDLFFTSGLTNHLPAMIPVAMLYGTPEDSAAEIAYLESRKYPISYVEMGEEPDGQYILPEDYGALYLQWAAVIHRVDPNLKLGGPIFEGVNEDIQVWPDAQGRTSWLGRFLDYLKAHGRLADLAFFSFEHYPYDSCQITRTDLLREPQLVAHILKVWRDDGLPANVPMFITESGMAPALTEDMVEITSALWLADNASAFLTAGGAALYHSPIQPESLRPGCHGWSTYGNFVADQNLKILGHTAQYFAGRLINDEWIEHGSGVHYIYPARSDPVDAAGNAIITAYPVQRPDGSWSILLVNHDQASDHSVRIVFDEQGGARESYTGEVRIATFGSEQYQWHAAGAQSHADPDGPIKIVSNNADANSTFLLPKESITVIRGRIAAPK